MLLGSAALTSFVFAVPLSVPQILAVGTVGAIGVYWIHQWGGKREVYNNGANGWKALESHIKEALQDGDSSKERLRTLRLEADGVFEAQNNGWTAHHAAMVKRL